MMKKAIIEEGEALRKAAAEAEAGNPTWLDMEAWAAMDRWDGWVADNGVEMFNELLKTARDHHRKYIKTLGPLRIENANLREELDRLQEVILKLKKVGVR